MAVFSSLRQAAALDFGLQWGLFAIAAALRTERFYDASGSATYILLAVMAYRRRAGRACNTPDKARASKRVQERQRALVIMVCMWAARLGFFLLRRIQEDGGIDRRFDGVRDQPRKFFVFWTLQAVWIFVCSLPVLLVQQIPDAPVARHHADVVGRALFALGWALEVVSDAQKRAFRADPANRGRFIAHGLWSVSRHPNYLGEITLWWGIFVAALPALRRRAAFVCAGVASPLFITWLLTRVSGVPLLEAAAKKKWGDDLAYQAYVAQTAVLLPGVW